MEEIKQIDSRVNSRAPAANYFLQHEKKDQKFKIEKIELEVFEMVEMNLLNQ